MTKALSEAIGSDIRGWDAIDDHRTGTVGDRQTAQWLADTIRAAGPEPHQDAFDLRRWVLRDCAVAVNGRAAAGVPLFDGGTTDANGITAPLAPLPGHRGGIGLASVGGAAGASANRAFAAARRVNDRPAVVAVTKGHADVPGLALQNADRFNAPFGPPVVQVGSEHDAWLREAAASGEAATVTADVEYEAAQGWNVRARAAGRDRALAPLVVMTPKSAWWVCTAERGGGIALLLALVRRFAAEPPARDVLFVATSGHELGHLGLDSFLGDNPGLGAAAHAWIHLGANFATRGGGTRLQASDTALLALARGAMDDAECPPDQVTPLGERPGGEARNIHDLGGRYVSYLGTNPWFHHPADRWPTTVDVHKTARLATAMLSVADRLAAP